MKIGIIGAGRIGQMFARHANAAGHHVIISNSRGPDTLRNLVAELGEHAEAGNVTDAAGADIVMIAVPWWKIEDALRHLPPFDGRIVIDATNAFASYAPLRVADLGGRVSSEIVAGLVPGARVVKAFNTALAAVFEGDPRVGGGRTVVFLSGDDASAKKAVADMGGRTSSEVVADLVHGARLLKAFNILPPERLLDPQQAGGRRVIFFSGDD